MKQSHQFQSNRHEIKQTPNISKLAVGVYIEIVLARAGILSKLEQSGVVPIVNSPNPYDPMMQASVHDQWWKDHPAAANAFQQDLENREQALQNLRLSDLLSK